MVGGLGWLRRRVCTCRLGSPIHQTDKKWIDFLHFRDFASPTMAHPRCRELCKRAGSLRLAELFRPILFLLLPGSYSFLKVDGSGVRVSAGSTLSVILRLLKLKIKCATTLGPVVFSIRSLLAFRPAAPTRKYHLLAPKFRPFLSTFFSHEKSGQKKICEEL